MSCSWLPMVPLLRRGYSANGLAGHAASAAWVRAWLRAGPMLREVAAKAAELAGVAAENAGLHCSARPT